MKNNEFDDMNDQDDALPGSGDEFGSDNVDFGEADGFDEFDAPAKSGNTLGDLWRDNPMLKFAVVGAGVVASVVLISLFTGGKDERKSSVGVPLQQSEAPGGHTTEAYRDAIEDVNEQRLERALRQGTSSIPIPTAGTVNQQGQVLEEEPPVTLDDPLANWRAAAQAPAQRRETPSRAVVGTASPATQPVGQAPEVQQAMGPDPSAVSALSNAISQQMQSIIGGHQIRGPQIMAVTAADYLSSQGGGGAGDTGVPEPTVQEILIPAGTIVYAQTLVEANTDAPGPVLARISSGVLNGYRILGTFSSQERFLTLNFNTVVIDGVSYGVNAIAIDPKTTLPAVATEVDRRYLSRFILPAAASFIEGLGSAIAQRESTTVTIDGSVVTSSTRDLNTREELASGLEAGTRVIARDLEREGSRIQPMIKVHAGTPIGVLFLQPVIKPE